MKPFMDKDFLLESETARKLYHDYAAATPILDYHCHIVPREIYKDRKFDNITQVRRVSVEIKKNIWTNAQFDIVTANRFKVLRDKFCEENIVHYTPKGYETFAYSHYLSGGSTVETGEAYGIYYVEGDSMRFVELLATSTLNAVKLLQAAREKTGCEKATVYLSGQSNLFLGEGETINWCMVKGISDQIYANLAIE